jgi:rhodanese-related sulfurtransferase
MRTSDPAIFAVGDAVEVTHFVAKSRVRIPLAGPANRQARIAANTIANIPSSYKETQGTSIIQVFDLVCAATGASQSVLQAANIPFQTVRVHGGSHAGYYPGASTLHLTVLFSPEDGRLLGAQACGKDGVDKRIDVLATGLRHGATVYDLEDYELAYAPPFGSAKDPINMAGFVAVNALRGTAPLVDPAEIDGAIKRGAVLLDVRNASERAAGKIEPSIHIPVNDLRARIDEVPKDKPIVAYCAVGLRGHIALRILKQQGFDARNLSGGFASYQLAKGRTQPRT